jgi:hypothetical protein
MQGVAYDEVTDFIGVKAGDVVILVDSKNNSFQTIGRSVSGVGVGELFEGNLVRHDFSLKIARKQRGSTKISVIKKKLLDKNHPIKSRNWQSKSFTKLTRDEFDGLMEAWWGIKNLSHDLCVS